MDATTTGATMPATSPCREGGVILFNVSWDAYAGLLRVFGDDHPSLRLTYLNGTLEITTTSRAQERTKKTIGRLLETWAVERDVRFDGYGAATFHKQAAACGLEPDQCYALGDLGDAPDLAIEVVETHGVVDKMAVYAGLGVREVWVWESGQMRIHVLQDGRYETSPTSTLLPTLDVAELAEFVRQAGHDQTAAVKRYRQRLRDRA